MQQPNDIGSYAPLALAVVARLARLPETIGIVQLGGLGIRAHIDVFSDLDLAVFVRGDTPYLPPFSFVCPVLGRTVEFNISQHLISTQDYEWEPEKRSAYRRGLVVHDPSGAVRRLLDARLRADDDFQPALVAALNQIYWRGVRHSRASAARGSLASAHQLLNEALGHVREALFALNRIEPPHTKWNEFEIGMLDLAPEGVMDKIGEALLVGALDAAELERRASIVEDLLAQLKALAAAAFPSFPSDPYVAWARELSGRQVRRITPIDAICDRLGGRMTASDIVLVRGGLSMALMRGPSGLAGLFAMARGDGLVPSDVLALAEQALGELGPKVRLELEEHFAPRRAGGLRHAG